jgi:hypothetical protein
VIITCVDARNLRQSKALGGRKDIQLQPFVKVSAELIRPGTRPRQLGKSFTTDIAKPQPLSAEGYAGLLKLASWKSEKDPTGASICLGDFSKNMKDHEIADRRSSLVINMQTINDIAK